MSQILEYVCFVEQFEVRDFFTIVFYRLKVEIIAGIDFFQETSKELFDADRSIFGTSKVFGCGGCFFIHHFCYLEGKCDCSCFAQLQPHLFVINA